MSYETIIVEMRGPVTLVTLNRPKALNALNDRVMNELSSALDAYEADDGQRCLVLTGSEKAFAAGADVKEMQGFGFADVIGSNFITRNWERMAQRRKPAIAAVAGYAWGRPVARLGRG